MAEGSLTFCSGAVFDFTFLVKVDATTSELNVEGLAIGLGPLPVHGVVGARFQGRPAALVLPTLRHH